MLDDESQLFKILKGFLYTFLIGAVYYAGAYGFSLFFTKDEEEREKVAKWNLIALVLEILLFIIVAIYSKEGDFSGIDFVFNLMIVHLAISFLGSLIYLVWWIFF